MHLSNLFNVLFVKNIGISKDFYSRILQQRIKLDFGTNIIYHSGIALWQIREDHIITTQIGLSNSRDAQGNRFELCFETDDIDRVYQELKSCSAVFVHEMHEELWGQRTVRFFDPDGHLVEVGESLEQFVLRFHSQGLTTEQISARTFMQVADVESIIRGQLRITDSEKADLPEILSLQKVCYRSEARLVNDYTIPPLMQDLASVEQECAEKTMLKAVINGEIIGSVRAMAQGDTCHIGKLIVDPAHQNKGIGRTLMAAIEARFPECARFELFTGEKSTKNISLYTQLGYSEFRREEVSDTLTFVFLEKINHHR